MASITVNTNGQTLTVNASISHWTSAALAVVASGDDDVPSTTTTPISSDYTMHFANTATTATVTVKQPDGTTLLEQSFEVNPGVGPRTLNPVPNAFQLAADAGGVGPFGVFTSGYYYFAGQGISVTTGAATADTLRLTPWWCPEDVTLSHLGAEVTSAGSGGSLYRIGVYADNGSCYPGSLVLAAGTIDGTSATVQDIALDPTLTVSKGLYWVGGVGQVSAPTMRTFNAPHPFPMSAVTSTPGASAAPGCYTQASVSGALPATFTTSRTVASISLCARLHFKVA